MGAMLLGCGNHQWSVDLMRPDGGGSTLSTLPLFLALQGLVFFNTWEGGGVKLRGGGLKFY